MQGWAMLGCSSRDQNKRVCVFFLGGEFGCFCFWFGRLGVAYVYMLFLVLLCPVPLFGLFACIV